MRRRLDIRLFQREAAAQIGVSVGTLVDWERALHTPKTGFFPKIIAFLDYVPDLMQARSFAEEVRRARLLKGMTQQQFAGLLGVDPSSIYHRENEKSVPSRKLRVVTESFLTSCRMNDQQPRE